MASLTIKRSNLRWAIAAPLFVFLAQVCWAGLVPRLVKDIDSTSYAGSSSPRQFTSVGTGFAFTAHQNSELWLHDDQENFFTVILRRQEIRQLDGNLYAARPAAGGWALWSVVGFPYYTAYRVSERTLIDLGPVHRDLPWNLWVFEADAGTGRGLWASGTQGWHEIARPLPLSDGRLLRDFTSYRSSALFVARHRTRGIALWVTNGTREGTFPVWAPEPARQAGLSLLGAVRGGLLLAVSGEQQELWVSDGTARGTRPLAELRQGPGAATLGEGAVADGRGFLPVDDGRRGWQLWSSDGTADGTHRITRFAAGSSFGSGRLGLAAIPGRWMFFADDGIHGREPWVTDGSAAGTHLLADLCPGRCGSSGAVLQALPADDGYSRERILFMAAAPGLGVELWSTDGTQEGTIFVRDLCRGACDGAVSEVALIYFDGLGELPTFQAATPEGSRTLWISDGTPERTQRLTPPEVTPTTRVFDGEAGGYCYGGGGFAAADADFGDELWCTGGTPETTSQAFDLDRTRGSGSYPQFLGAAGDRAVFIAAARPFGYQLWSSDGTASGTARIPVLPRDQVNWTRPAVSLGERTVFVAQGRGAADAALWATDGTAPGTVPVTPPGVAVRELSPYRVGSDAFFLAEDPEHGLELWASGGTPSSTRLVADLAPGPAPVEIAELLNTTLRRQLLFARLDDRHLWLSDGTAAGTLPLLDRYPFLAALDRTRSPLLAEFEDRLYFLGFPGFDEPAGLWVSDWTFEGTHRLDLPGVTSVERFFTTASRLFIRGFDAEGTKTLWATDGTPDGTVRLPVALAFEEDLPSLAFGDFLVFGDSDGQPWVSDGSLAGTRALHDPSGSSLRYSWKGGAVLGNRLVFSGSYFSPCYVWDGSGDTAFPVGGEGLCGGNFLTVGSRIFFTGFEPTTGGELWVLEDRSP